MILYFSNNIKYFINPTQYQYEKVLSVKPEWIYFIDKELEYYDKLCMHVINTNISSITYIDREYITKDLLSIAATKDIMVKQYLFDNHRQIYDKNNFDVFKKQQIKSMYVNKINEIPLMNKLIPIDEHYHTNTLLRILNNSNKDITDKFTDTKNELRNIDNGNCIGCGILSVMMIFCFIINYIILYNLRK